MIEKSKRRELQATTDSALRPGDFTLGSRKSHAASQGSPRATQETQTSAGRNT